MSRTERGEGFTLIELLIVIGILGILATIILVAVDPAKRFRDSRDSRRASEATSLLNAILNYIVDNKGSLPGGLVATSTAQVIGTNGSGCDSGCAAAAPTTSACANMTAALVDQYIGELPIDPSGGSFTAAFTGYYAKVTTNKRIEVGSCNPEGLPSIKIRR